MIVENNSKDEELVDVDIDLTLEDWGRVALLAHRRNITINAMLEVLIATALKEAKKVLEVEYATDASAGESLPNER